MPTITDVPAPADTADPPTCSSGAARPRSSHSASRAGSGHGRGAAVPPAGAVHVRRRDDAVPARQRRGSPDLRTWHEALRARSRGRRPAGRRRVLAVVAVLAVAGAALALRLEPSAATDTLAGRGSDTYEATERYRERFGDHSIVVLVRGELPTARAHRQPRPADRARGLPVGQQARGRAGAGRRGSPVRRAGPQRKPVQVVYGPGTFINAAVAEIQDQLQAQPQAQAAEAARAGRAARKARRRRRASRAPSSSGSRARPAQLRLRRLRPRPARSSTLRYGARAHRRAERRRPRLRLRARLRPVARGGDAEGALRLPVPHGGLGGRSRCA